MQVRRNDTFTYHNRWRQPPYCGQQQENFTHSCALYLLKLYYVLNEMWSMPMNTKIITIHTPQFNSYINRLDIYDLHEDYYNSEVTTIKNILHNNAFPIHPPTPQPPPDTNKKQLTNTRTRTPPPKWATFTYIRKETNFIINLFKKTNIKIAFQTNNTIQRLLMHKQQKTEIHSQSGVYKLTCPTCGKVYVRQTGRNFATRFQEHKNAFRTASQSSNFAKHLIEHAHSFSPIHNTMQILQLQNKGAHLNIIERFYIYAEYTKDNHLNDDSTISPNKIFDTLLKPHQP